MSGVFQIDREIFDNSIWNNVTEFRLFFYIVGKAVWKKEGLSIGGVQINRGQFLRSYRNLREDLMYVDNNAVCYYSLSTIKRTVDKLARDGRLETIETKLGTLFTVVKYDIYQGFERFETENLERRKNDERTTVEQQQNNKNKDNKENTVNKYIYSYLEQKWSMPINSSMVDELDHLLKEYGEEKVKAGIDICTEMNIRTVKYLKGVVRNGSKRKEAVNGKSSGVDEEAAKLREEGIGF